MWCLEARWTGTGSDYGHLENPVVRIKRDILGLFTFPEHQEAEPTNDSSG